MNEFNNYTKMQKQNYSAGTTNHMEHNSNHDYWDILLGDLKDSEKWNNKVALDFACGKGRNVINMNTLCNWSRIDGIDISSSNIDFCRSQHSNLNSIFYCNNGIDISDLKSEEYDFVMSTISLQHIPVYDIRKSLIIDIFRCMKKDGLFSFQMGYGTDLSDVLGRPKSSYYENFYDAISTNSDHDVRITNVEDIISDLTNIGFTSIETLIRPSFSDIGHPNWIYIKAYKK